MSKTWLLHLRVGAQQCVALRYAGLIQGGLHCRVVELWLVNGVDLLGPAVQRGKLDVDE
jgi:hypothetical protein